VTAGGWVYLERRAPLTDRQTRIKAVGLLLEDLATLIDPDIRWAFPVPRRRRGARVADMLDRLGGKIVDRIESRVARARMTTYPAHIDPTPENIDELRAVIDQLDDGPGLACHWGDPIACTSDNNKRASWAARAVLAYADKTFPGGCDEDFPTVIGDMLGDLMHLCDLLDITFEGLCDKAASPLRARTSRHVLMVAASSDVEYENTDEMRVNVRLAAGQVDVDLDPDRFEEVTDAIRDALEAGIAAAVNRIRDEQPDLVVRIEIDGHPVP
jgi:hypothetical protein